MTLLNRLSHHICMHKILRALIISDFFILSSFGLIQPIFAVFMIQKITGTTLTAIGVAVTIQLVTKAILQLFVARWTDEETGNQRELFTLLIGSVIMSLVPFGYIFSHTLGHIYLLQFILGIGAALAYPGWIVIFSRHIRDKKAGAEWGVYSSLVSLGTGAAAFLGAYMAELYSFKHLFVGVGILSLLGTSFIISVFKQEFTREHHPARQHAHAKHKK